MCQTQKDCKNDYTKSLHEQSIGKTIKFFAFCQWFASNSNMSKFYAFLIITACLVTANIGVMAQSPARQTKAQNEIRQVLENQVTAWNKGDIDAFMQGYWNSPDTTFSGRTLTRGWQTVLDNYKKNYDTPEKRGVLSFDNLEISVLSKDAAYVIGEWAVKSDANPKGRFTLVFRKLKNGWRIVHDQTSWLRKIRLERFYENTFNDFIGLDDFDDGVRAEC